MLLLAQLWASLQLPGGQATVPVEAIVLLLPFSMTVIVIEMAQEKAQRHMANQEILWSENQYFRKS